MAEETQVLVRFTTKLPPELHVPSTEVAVPASLKRYGLSQIINHLLALDPPRPFDFIIDGELLRRSLEHHLLQHNISPEAVVEVEYVPAVVPPEPKNAIPHDDWITAVSPLGSSSSSSVLASGSADGVIRLWNSSGDCQLEFSAHKMGVNALASFSSSSSKSQQPQQQQQSLLLSAGKDHKVRLWQITQQQQQYVAACAVVYSGHAESAQCVAVSPGGDYCCSGGWDGQLLMWRTGQQVLDEAVSNNAAAANGEAEEPAAAGNRKKRKLQANGTAAAAPAPAELQPTAALPGHVHCIAALAWPDDSVLYSGGWDHSVRRYDVETRTNTDTYNGSKAIYAVAAASDSSSSNDVVAFGGSDKVLRIWDSRSVKGEGLDVRAYTAHEGWISAVAWRPGSSYHIATASHDGVVKMWDIRTAVPLGSLQQHSDKVLCVGWWDEQVLVSGGADCKLQQYQMA